jgi:hypothetical protein
MLLLPIQVEREASSDKEDCGRGPVKRLGEEVLGRGDGSSLHAGPDELLAGVSGGGFAKEGEGGAQALELGGAMEAGLEVIVHDGRGALAGQGRVGEDDVAELLVSEVEGH